MNRQPVSCASIIDQATTSFVIFHQHLGCFHSDWHQHTWGQLIYAEQGCIHLHSQAKMMLVPRGYGVWIPPDMYHEIWSDSPQLHMRSICFPAAYKAESLANLVSVFPVTVLLREMIRYSEKWGQEQQDSPQVITFLQAIQDMLSGGLSTSTLIYLPSTNCQRLLPVLGYIQGHLSEQLNVQWIASEFGLSVRTLSRLFSQRLGISFSSYCRIARIMRALELIEMGHDNVSQLALEVGYESLATFSTNFLEICGHRPFHFIREKRN